MIRQVFYRFLAAFLLKGCSNYNPVKVRRACRSKAKAKAAFAKIGLPCANGAVFINPLSAYQFAKKNGFPLVIKPNVGGFSRGAYFPIENYRQLFIASILVKKWWHASIIEQYLDGKNYRIVATKFGLMSVLRRYPPFVVGDGKSTISSLIDTENTTRKNLKIPPIRKNHSIKSHLKKHHLSLKNIPQKAQTINLHHQISLTSGGVIEVLDKSILSKNNHLKIQQILTFFNANILGIDVICEQGLEVDFTKQNCIFLELNSRPYLKMADSPRFGKPQNLSHFYHNLEQLKINDKNIF